MESHENTGLEQRHWPRQNTGLDVKTLSKHWPRNTGLDVKTSKHWPRTTCKWATRKSSYVAKCLPLTRMHELRYYLKRIYLHKSGIKIASVPFCPPQLPVVSAQNTSQPKLQSVQMKKFLKIISVSAVLMKAFSFFFLLLKFNNNARTSGPA